MHARNVAFAAFFLTANPVLGSPQAPAEVGLAEPPRPRVILALSGGGALPLSACRAALAARRFNEQDRVGSECATSS